MRKLLIIVVSILFLACLAKGQGRLEEISNRLDSLVVLVPGLNQNIDISVSKLTIQEFVRTIAQANSINITIDPSIGIVVTNNFKDVPAKDILIFLCKEHELDLNIIGRIISITKSKPVIVPQPRLESRKPKIDLNIENQTLNLDLRNDSLYSIIREIIKLTGVNIICTPDLNSKLVTAFIVNMNTERALSNIAFSNDLELIIKEENYFLQKKENTTQTKGNAKGKDNEDKGTKSEIFIGTGNLINIDVDDLPLSELINTVAFKTNENCYIIGDLKTKISARLSNLNFEDFLKAVLNGTSITFQKSAGMYLIGESTNESMRPARTIKIMNRPVNDVVKIIPDKFKKCLILQEYPDLNSLIVCGSDELYDELVDFINEIDQIVPMVLIEVIIIENNSSFSVSTGINAGIGASKTNSGGNIFPEVDYHLNSTSVNNLINSFNGFGWFNLGKVTPNFYLNIKAMEDEGLIKIKSTPKLATLNGHEAKLKIGKTEYYLEESSQIFANQTTTQTKTKQFKSVTADFTMTINPIVSGNEQVTLEIQVTQSDFTGTRLSADAPPDQVTRSFSSLIRISNGETVLLGGLEEKSDRSNGSGVPLLSRIPIIKWFFSSRSKSKKNNRLNIFIKPSILY